MIRNQKEYSVSRRQLADLSVAIEEQRSELASLGYDETQVNRGTYSLRRMRTQIAQEMAEYESLRQGNVPRLTKLSDLGRWLIANRIALGVTQRELARRLGISEAVISRDEKNEYHAITVERAQRILDALSTTISMAVSKRPDIVVAVPAAIPPERVSQIVIELPFPIGMHPAVFADLTRTVKHFARA